MANFDALKKLLIDNGVLSADCKSTIVDDNILDAMDKLKEKSKQIAEDVDIAGVAIEALLKDQAKESLKEPFQVPMPDRYYGEGSKGPGVQKLEVALQMLGFLHRYINDYYGTSTKKAIMAFQKHVGLVVDGYAGKNTVSTINAVLKAIGGQYTVVERFGSLIHVYEVDAKRQVVDPELGKRSKLERLSQMKPTGKFEGQMDVARINCGFFWQHNGIGYEHIGTFFDEDSYIVASHPEFYDMAYCKDGVYRAEKLAEQKLTSAQFKQRYEWVIGTSYTLMVDGKKDIRYGEHFDHSKYYNPRTFGGNKANNNLVLFVANGRGKNGSKGLTANQQASVCAEYELINAWNWDGGGSSTMVLTVKIPVKGVVKELSFVVNEPTDGRERYIGSALFVYNK